MKSLLPLFLLLPLWLTAQEFSLHFPYFAGKNWNLILPVAQRADTILSGVIPEDGRVIISMPEKYRDYRGIARWMLREGGGIDVIVNGENFSVECLSDKPSRENIRYIGSPENDFLHQNHELQDQLLFRYEAIRMLEGAYPRQSRWHKAALKEKQGLEKQWAKHRAALAASPLYAARFREIVDITRGIGQSMDQNVQEKAADADDFISRKLSWPALYHSNHWSGVIYNWVQMHVMTIQQDDALLSSANRILQRIDDPVLYTSFCEFMTRFLIKEGKDSIVMALAPAIKASGKLLRNDGILAQFTALQTGDLAPDLIFPPYAGHSSIRQQALSVLPTRGASEKYTLLVFYQSGCGPCEDLLEQLIPQYPELNANGVRVVAMSADRDRLLFENIAAAHPWPDKYCDGLGMEGPNFSRYAVAGTPTLFLLDTEGKILAREASLERVAKLWP